MYIYLLISILLATVVGLSKGRKLIRATSALFVAMQFIFGAVVAIELFEQQSTMFFTFDRLGLMFYAIMAIIASLSFHISDEYLIDNGDRSSLHQYRFYTISMMLLCCSSACVYFANNIAVTWIFLEATTLCTAGLVYHQRKMQSLEATWKYIFVCSVGIAMAYLGILLISSYADGDISYDALVEAIASADPLYMKAAFLLIIAGYSCKMEVFPLYTIGIDANYAAPTPASAVISTVLVNSGFVALFRVFSIFEASEIGSWCSNVLIVVGVLSVIIGALYIRRTNNYKRFLAYSTTENMGLVIIGLGVGGIGTIAALLHIVVHALLKSGMFTLMAQVGKSYGSYRINRIGGYSSVSPLGAGGLMLGALSLTAFPPSGLFVSEMMLFTQIIEDRRWWLIAIIVTMLCVVIYSMLQRITTLCFKRTDLSSVDSSKNGMLTTYGAVLFIVVAMIIGATQPTLLMEYILSIIAQ